MNSQTIIEFGTPKFLHGQYPFKYHMLRIGTAEMSNRFWHVNSLFEGYNDSNYPQVEKDTRIGKYSFAYSQQDIEQLMEKAAKETQEYKTHYIMAKMDSNVYESMAAFKD